METVGMGRGLAQLAPLRGPGPGRLAWLERRVPAELRMQKAQSCSGRGAESLHAHAHSSEPSRLQCLALSQVVPPTLGRPIHPIINPELS